MKPVTKKKTYVKLPNSMRKQYFALARNTILKKPCKTATEAEIYAAAVRDRYFCLLMAAARAKKVEEAQ